MTIEEYFNDKIDWKFFNAMRDKLLKYEDMGKLDCEINIEFKLDAAGYTKIFRYKSDKARYHPYLINDVIKHFENNNSELYYCVFINDSDCMGDFIDLLNSKKYGYSVWRNGSYDARYKKIK